MYIVELNSNLEEFKLYKQFVYWKYEYEEGKDKPTKRPINPYTGKYASPTNPEHWCWHNELIADIPNIDGIGFVINGKTDPFICIDLDQQNDPEIQEKQTTIYNAFDSYSEISPSGNGCHIWIKGKTFSNRNRAKVEIYTSGHFMTITGNCCRNLPVKEHQFLVNQLWDQMEVKPKKEGIYLNEPEVYTDYKILEMASSAANGQKFIDLFEGRWQQYYPDEDMNKASCNESDQALCNMIAFYTQNREQIKRIFRSSVLGQRIKAKREDYFEHPTWGMLNKAFDKQIPPIDLTALKANLEQQLTVNREPQHLKPDVIEKKCSAESVKEAIQLPAIEAINICNNSNIATSEYLNIQNFEYTVPPGLVGEIACFLYNAAPRPVPEIAITGALGLMSGICGRSYNISGTGLNQYLLLLAFTGAGKEAISNGIDKLMAEALKTVESASKFIGPGEIASPQALMKYMSKNSQCFMSLVGEFGLKFKTLCGDRASTNELGLKRIFLDLYNKSGKSSILKPLIYSDKDKNTEAINSPAFSMLGESTPELFYENLNAALISDGLLPRFTIIEYKGKRPKLNEQHLFVKPSQSLLDKFTTLCSYAVLLNNGNNVLDIKLDNETTQMFKDFDIYCDNQINTASNDVTRQLWNRAHIKALKLAGLLSVGCNYLNPIVNKECATWALQLITNDVTNMLTRFDSGEIGQNNCQNEQIKEIKKVIRKYYNAKTFDEIKGCQGTRIELFEALIIPHSFISTLCRTKAAFKNDKLGPLQAIKNCLQSLVECDDIVEVCPLDKRKKGINSNAKCYMVSNMKL